MKRVLFVCVENSNRSQMAEAFAHNEFGVRDIQQPVEGRTVGSLNAVIGPEGLRAIGHLDFRKDVLSGVRGCK